MNTSASSCSRPAARPAPGQRAGRVVNVARARTCRARWTSTTSVRARRTAITVYTSRARERALHARARAALDGTGVTANCLHPGFVRTGFGKNGRTPALVRGQPSTSSSSSSRPWLLSPEKGAATSIYLASSPEVEGVTCKYFADCRETPSSPASYDEAAPRKLFGK